jgi:hypothetical protein
MNVIKAYAPAIVSAVVAVAAYLTGVIPQEGGFGDVTLVQWLGAIGFVAAALGFTAITPKGNELARLDNGVVRAGPAAVKTTGDVLGASVTVDELVPDDGAQ